MISLPSNTVHTVLDMNTHITQLVNERDMPVTQTFSLSLDQSGTPGEIRIQLLLPKQLSETDSDQLAVVVMMAETPGEQQVDHRWGCGLECFLASNSQVGVAKVDVRGAAGQGTSWQQSVRGRLGVMETQDMEQVVRFLAGLKHIDQSKIAVFGQGYGGFLALNVLLSNQPVLSTVKCGLTVAPITNWMYSTTFTTERLLGLPGMQDNWLDYERTSLVGGEDLTCLRNKQVKMVHGVADRRVLLENTMMLSKRMVEQNILFEQQVYLLLVQ